MASRVPRFPSSRRTRPAGLRLAVWLGLVLLAMPTAGLAQQRPVLLLFGDSLTAGYGLAEADGFAGQLGRALEQGGFAVAVRNAGVSGDTTSGGLARLDWSLAEPGIRVAIVELGANDALRGLPPEQAEANLDAILTKLAARDVTALLAGMLAPPNLGTAYYDRFAAIYPRLAEKHGVPLYRFFLDGVASRRDLNQPDGLHPNAKGVAVIVRGIMPMVAKLLETTGIRPGRATEAKTSSE